MQEGSVVPLNGKDLIVVLDVINHESNNTFSGQIITQLKRLLSKIQILGTTKSRAVHLDPVAGNFNVHSCATRVAIAGWAPAKLCRCDCICANQFSTERSVKVVISIWIREA